jgi:alpha-amylase
MGRMKFEYKYLLILVLALVLALSIAACDSSNSERETNNIVENISAEESEKSQHNNASGEPEVVYEQGTRVFYEIFVRAFYDTNGDGIGDLNGVTEQLDYLEDLGVEGIWLMPINPSPSYHGYDVTNYYDINPEYGTLEDMKRLLDEAEKRDIKILMDLVVNHSSNQHPWFVNAVEGVDAEKRDWYTWAEDTHQEPSGNSATGGRAWHPNNGTHYLGTFWDGMPDLNFDNQEVRDEMIRIGQFWLELGVDGFRLDAAKHIFEDLQSQSNDKDIAEKNIVWWQAFREGLNEIDSDAIIIGEVWSSMAKIGPYLSNGAFDASFNFDLADHMLSIAKSEKNNSLVFSLKKIRDYYYTVSGASFNDAIFLSNHDQNRVMSELSGNVEHAKIAASLLLTLPGHPFIYYGEEIGMQGMKPDEFIREPLLWYADRAEGEGQTTWVASRFNRKDPVSIETQQADANSLLNHYKTMIQWRHDIPALNRGDLVEFKTNNRQIVSFERITSVDRILVLHNVSEDIQTVDITEAGMKEIIKSNKEGAHVSGGKVELPGYSTLILK